eukprot:TRINITY_DN4841_c0_g3_i1.p1 TRINITY_DN4841_c0_g3~~TRINITY_DN4841_c0_g3_i1.p1  ORF type:complete len:237 (-),score=30.43 TRINITY_DN4841_c0_g3_i1:5-715(-)
MTSYESIPSNLSSEPSLREALKNHPLNAPSIREAIKSHPFYHPIANVLLWNNLFKSFSIFVIGTLFFVLVIYAEYSVVSLLSAIFFIILAVCLAYGASYELRGRENPLKEKLKFLNEVSKPNLQEHVRANNQLWDAITSVLRRIFYFSDLSLSLRASLLFSFLGFVVGPLIPGITLLFIVFLAAFSIPRIYQERQKDIDNIIQKIQVVINNAVNKASEKIPPGLNEKIFGKKKKTE